MTINKFIAEVKNRGIARTNRYEVVVPFPQKGPWAVDGNIAPVATLFCDAINLPGVNIATSPQKMFGETRELPYQKDFDTVTMSFYVDTEMQLRTAFDKWMAMIVDPFTRTIGYYTDYVSDVDIYVKTVDNSTPMLFRLYEAYPKTIQSVQMDANSKDVMKMQITLQYRYWLSMNYSSPMQPTTSIPPSDPQSFLTGTGYNISQLTPQVSNVAPGPDIITDDW